MLNKTNIQNNGSFRKILKLVLFVLVLSSSYNSHAQQLIYEHFGIREGIASRTIRDIVFDADGLVWIATANGLNRFDGYQFITFSSHYNQAGRERLSQSNIKKLGKTADGQILIFYQDLYSSFDIINPNTFEVKRIEVSLSVKGEPRSLHLSPEGQVYIFSKTPRSSSITKYDPVQQTFENIIATTEAWEKLHPSVQFIPCADGFLVFDQQNQLRLITQEQIYPIDAPLSNKIKDINFLYQDRNQRTWLSFQGMKGVYTFDQQNKKLQLFNALAIDKIYANVWEDQVGNLLFNQVQQLGTQNISKGLFCVQLNGEIINFEHLIKAGEFIYTISSPNFFHSVLIGTDTGLIVAQNSISRVVQYLTKNIDDAKRGYSMRGMCSDKEGNIYFGREVSRFYKLNTESQTIDTLQLYDPLGATYEYSSSQGIAYDSSGYLWLPTSQRASRAPGILVQYDIENCTNTNYIYNDYFTAYALDKKQLWLGARKINGSSSLVYFDIEEKKFHVFSDNEDRNPFINTHIRFILPTVNNELWIGTENGLFRVNTKSKQWEHYIKGRHSLFPNAIEVPLADNSIYALHLKAQDSILWLGTLNGLNKFDIAKNEWELYTTTHGLASNSVASILPGKDEALWIGTYDGLTYLTPNRNDSRCFFSIDGFSHNEFNRFSAIIDQDSLYYFGGVNGVNAFKPDKLLEHRAIPKTVITSFSYYDNKIDSTITQYCNLKSCPSDFTIEPSVKYFSFDFTLPIYMPEIDNQFRYKIGKDSQEWIYLNSEHNLRFNDLRAGKYSIFIQGADPSGNWSSDSFRINLNVKQVVYRRLWFVSLMLLIAALSIYFLLRYRLEEKLRMERLRTQLASDLHDEVSGLLAGISLQSELLRSQVESEKLDLKLQNIRQASQRAMSKMSDVIWSIDSRRDRMEDLINRMKEHAEEVLLPLNIRYELHTHAIETKASIPANIRQNLYFIYKEAINNVAKHSDAKLVKIILKNSTQHFYMNITDNGTNAHEPKTKNKRKGQGLSNLKMRAQRLDAHLEIIASSNYIIKLKMKKF